MIRFPCHPQADNMAAVSNAASLSHARLASLQKYTLTRTHTICFFCHPQADNMAAVSNAASLSHARLTSLQKYILTRKHTKCFFCHPQADNMAAVSNAASLSHARLTSLQKYISHARIRCVFSATHRQTTWQLSAMQPPCRMHAWPPCKLSLPFSPFCPPQLTTTTGECDCQYRLSCSHLLISMSSKP